MNRFIYLLVDDRPENLLALEAVLEANNIISLRLLQEKRRCDVCLKYDFAGIVLDVKCPVWMELRQQS